MSWYGLSLFSQWCRGQGVVEKNDKVLNGGKETKKCQFAKNTPSEWPNICEIVGKNLEKTINENINAKQKNFKLRIKNA